MYEEIKGLLDIIEKNGKNYNIEKIKKTYLYAKELHNGQFRQSGEPYISHPIAVAEIVADMGLDTDSICAALLHDTVEDCSAKTNIETISKLFGENVAILVDGLTKNDKLTRTAAKAIDEKQGEDMENTRKMLLAMTKDIRVIFIKLCDRLHNMRTLSAKPEEKQREKALETMYIFAPLAHRLGMQKIKHELENLSLYYLDRPGYEEVENEINIKYGKSRNLIETATEKISEKLKENHIEFTLEGRIKSIYSLYRKMYNQGKTIDEIYDFYALRIIVNTELDCYTVLGIVHEMFKSIPGRFKDYISTPKPNMYRSLHTTVIGSDGIPFEVQIRTYEMHEVAQYGLAAHWKYKSGDKSNEEIDKKLAWVAKLIETDDDAMDSEEFLNVFKTDIFNDQTFVFTPNGDVYSFPLGSTPIDFAYAIHTAVGNSMVGAKINNAIVPIDRVLQNGDIVEIMTSQSAKGPSRDWLNIVKTSEAKSKIRQYFKKEQRGENIRIGREAIKDELSRYGTYTDDEFNLIIDNVAKRIGMNDAEDLVAAVGFGGISVNKLAIKLRDEYNRVVAPKEEKSIESLILENIKNAKTSNKASKGGVIVDGASGCQVKFAKCCNPLPGDDIIGFVTRGFGISVHKKDCPNAIFGINDPEQSGRWLTAYWEDGSIGGGMYEASMLIVADNTIGLLADISATLADMKVQITQLNTQIKPDGAAYLNMTISCKSVGHYNSIVQRIRSIPHVVAVERNTAGGVAKQSEGKQ